MKVLKRNGQLVDFDFSKIEHAVSKAFESVGKQCDENVLNNVNDCLKKKDGNSSISVESIQDLVENVLMDCKHYDVAKSFIRYRKDHEYARFIKGRLDYMEEYSDSINNAASSSETDANANVTMKNVANLEGEVYKTTNRVIQRQRMKDKLNEMFPEVAKQYEKDLDHHIIYAHDESTTPVLKQYCMAVSLYPLMTEGVGNIDGVTPTQPNDLSSFSGQLTNLIFLLSSQCKGAVAVSEYFIALNYYVIKEFGPNWYDKLNVMVTSDHCINQKTIKNSIHKAFKQFLYGVNQPAGNRGSQSPFTNISYFDHTYFDSMFGNFCYPDGTKPEWKAVDTLQRLFMKFFNELRTKQVLTFPVESFAMVHDGHDIIDKDYKQLCAEMYAEGHSFFTYISDSADSLASCCYSKDTNVIVMYNDCIRSMTFEQIKVENIQDRDYKIFSCGSWKTGKLVELPNRQMYKVTTINGLSMTVTDNHRNNCKRGMVLTKDLTTDDYLLVCNTPFQKVVLCGQKEWQRIVSIEKVEYSDNVFCFEMDDKNDDMFTLANGIHNYNCRLKNEIGENTFSPTSGLTGVMTGSVNVITLNINRITQDWWRAKNSEELGVCIRNFQDFSSHEKEDYAKYISTILERVYKYHIAFKTMLYEMEEKKMFASSNAGYIYISKLFSTIGINGLNEAARFLGLEVNNNAEYLKFLQLVLGTIKEENAKHSIHDKKRPFIFNSEVVPAESLGGKNYNWDKADGYYVPSDENLYNSYFFNAHDENTSVLDKFILHGRQTYQYTDGGSAAHINLEEHLSKEQYLKLIDFAIEQGTNYFTFNIPNTKCDDCGFIAKHPFDECPKCHSKNVTYYTRVIGYLRPVKSFGKDRQIEAAKRVYLKTVE